MKVEIENKLFEDKKQALTWLAFCHYPVVVKADGEEKTFISFLDASEYIESLFS